MPKFHGDDYLEDSEREEEYMSDQDLDVNGLFDIDEEEDDRQEAEHIARMERQRLEKVRFEKEEADAMQAFRKQLYTERKQELEKKKKEAREQVEKQVQADEEADAIREGELKAAELLEAAYQAAREAKRLEEVSKKKNICCS